MKPALIAAFVGLTAPAALLAQTTTPPPDAATGATPSDHMTSDPASAGPSASDAAPSDTTATGADTNAGDQPVGGGTAAASDTDTAERGTTEAPTAVTGADAANTDVESQAQETGATPAGTAASGDAAATTSDISADADGDVQELVNQIASGGMFEIRSSEIALERSSDPDVQDFAQTMITDHGSIMTELEVLAEARNLTVPTEISGPAAEHLRAVEAAEGDIDEVYLDHQAQAHAETLELLEPWTIEPEDAGVGAFAQKTLQAVTTHAERLDAIRD